MAVLRRKYFSQVGISSSRTTLGRLRLGLVGAMPENQIELETKLGASKGMNLGLLYGGLDIRAGGLKRDTALLKGLTVPKTDVFSTDVLLYT